MLLEEPQFLAPEVYIESLSSHWPPEEHRSAWSLFHWFRGASQPALSQGRYPPVTLGND